MPTLRRQGNLKSVQVPALQLDHCSYNAGLWQSDCDACTRNQMTTHHAHPKHEQAGTNEDRRHHSALPASSLRTAASNNAQSYVETVEPPELCCGHFCCAIDLLTHLHLLWRIFDRG